MAKHHQRYHSPYAAMLTEQRYDFANQLADQTGLDPSQIMFGYLVDCKFNPNFWTNCSA